MPSTNGHGSKKAILYARVSTEEQARSGYSLAQQLEALRDDAACDGYKVLEEVMDPGQSGCRKCVTRYTNFVHKLSPHGPRPGWWPPRWDFFYSLSDYGGLS